MSVIKVYQVINYPTWACPGMLVTVEKNRIVSTQQNPDNTMTLVFPNEGEEDLGEWNPLDYYSIKLISPRPKLKQ